MAPTNLPSDKKTETYTGGYGMNLVGELEAHAKAAGVEREVDLFETSSQLKPTVTRSSGSLTTKAIARNGGSPRTSTSRFSSSSHTQGQIEGQATADANKAFSSLVVAGEGLGLLTYGTSLTAETDDDAEDVKATTNVQNTWSRLVTKAELSSNAEIESTLDKVTVALVMNGEDIDGLGGAALGAAEGAPEASITLSGYTGATGSVSGQNQARVLPGTNPDVVSQHVVAKVEAQGDSATKAIATGEKLRTILVQDQETGNGTFDFGIKELTLTVAGLSPSTFASVEFQLWNDTDGDGDEDGAAVWSANARLGLVYNPPMGGYVGQISAGGAWCWQQFLVLPPPIPGLAAPGVAFTATLIPEARLQRVIVTNTAGSYILTSKYRAEATSGVPASAAVEYDVSRAPLIERATVANLTAYRPVQAYFLRTAVPGENDPVDLEQDPNRGPGIRVNRADVRDARNLIEVIIRREAGQGDLVLHRQSNDLNVYRSPTGLYTDEIPFVQDNETGPLGITAGGEMTVWVEWAGTGSATTADLMVERPCSSQALDTLKFHRFQSIVVALGGDGADPGVGTNGAFQIGRQLYERGYDVHMYNENTVLADEANAATIGTGLPYTDIVTAIQHRRVSQVAAFGHSHGGGATRDLAQGLANNAGAIGAFTVPYTAYIDSIHNTGFTGEPRRPPLTTHHVNLYQTTTPILQGVPVTGAATNLNVNTVAPWGTNLGHTDMDNDLNVQGIIIDGTDTAGTNRAAGLTTHVSR